MKRFAVLPLTLAVLIGACCTVAALRWRGQEVKRCTLHLAGIMAAPPPKPMLPPMPMVMGGRPVVRYKLVGKDRKMFEHAVKQQARGDVLRSYLMLKKRLDRMELTQRAEAQILLAMLDRLASLEVKIQYKNDDKTHTMTADVSLDDDEALERAYRETACSDLKMVVVLTGENGDGGSAADVETPLQGALKDADFTVYDWDYISGNTPFRDLAIASLRDKNKAQELGGKFRANVIITGRVKARPTGTVQIQNRTVYVCTASVDLKALRADDGTTICTEHYEANGNFYDEEKARQNAIKNLNRAIKEGTPKKEDQPATESFVTLLKSRLKPYQISVDLADANPAEADRIQSQLEKVREIREVKQETATKGIRFQIKTTLKPEELGERIEEAGRYHVSSYETL